MISGSADNTIRLWEIGATRGEQPSDPQLKLIEGPANLRFRSMDLVSTEPNQLLTAYSDKTVGILDLETGERILDFDFKNLDEEVGEGKWSLGKTFKQLDFSVNKILSHPTMNVTITGSTDRRIRFFDNNTGKLIHSSVAHVESISTLSSDPNGLILLSGSDDG